MLSSKVYDLGAGGVRIGAAIGGIVPESKVTNYITIDNNYIFDGGYFY